MVETYYTPILNLKAVVKATGVNGHTLRAWERRYGLPQPERTQGGHRRYSQHDVDVIRWLTARQDDGMSIKGAVDLWHALKADGQDPLQAVAASARAVAPSDSARVGQRQPKVARIPTSTRSPGDSAIDGLRRAWIAACLAFDKQQAQLVLAKASTLYPPETVCLDLLQKGVAEIGERWFKGEATVQQEHLASELAVRRVEALIAATPPPTRPGRVLAACPAGEEHFFGLLLLTYLLRQRGWDVLYLGANMPREHIEATIESTGPRLAILAAQQLHTAASLLRMGELIHRLDVPLGFGGRVFNCTPGLRARVPGHFLGPTLEGAPSAVERLMSAPAPPPSVEPLPESIKQALAHYREHKARIEAHAWEAMKPENGTYDCLLHISQTLAQNIVAALTLGDIRFLDPDMDWLRELCSESRPPDELLTGYLTAYHQATVAYLDERGAPIVNWLAEQVDVIV